MQAGATAGSDGKWRAVMNSSVRYAEAAGSYGQVCNAVNLPGIPLAHGTGDRDWTGGGR